ncbi:MAG TPA: SRPBCC family protein [Acidimicrobiia bacterium]|nr:SRPBCC family protein [Acidimicrobiia bacterium]
MAHYRCRIRTPLAQVDAFDFMADVRNFQTWDPGVVSVAQVSGDGAAPDAMYDVVTSNGGREMTFRYSVTAFDPPIGYTIVGRKAPFTSTDLIEVEPAEDGSIVTYQADLTMPFPLSLADRWLQKVFDRIGDAAATGLADALDGEWLR